MPGSRLRQGYAGSLAHSAAEASTKAAGPGMTRSSSLPSLHEIQNLIRQPRIVRVDRIDFRHMAMLRQDERARAPHRPFAGRFLEVLELPSKHSRIELRA